MNVCFCYIINTYMYYFRPGWLTRVIDWTIYSSPIVPRDSTLLDLSENPFTTQSESEGDNNQLSEVEFMFQRIRVVYATLDDWNSSDADKVVILFFFLVSKRKGRNAREEGITISWSRTCFS